MNYNRRQLLSRILFYKVGLLLPALNTATTTEKVTENLCPINAETQKIIQNIYGKTSVARSEHIKFVKLQWGFHNWTGSHFKPKKATSGTEILVTNSPQKLPFTVELNPAILQGPITFIMERYNYHGVFIASEYVAQYKTNKNVSNISFWTKIKPPIPGAASGTINMFAFSQQNNSVVYTCRQVHYSWGEDGCC